MRLMIDILGDNGRETRTIVTRDPARFSEIFAEYDPFQTQGAPCFETPTEQDWEFLFGNDPEDDYQP